MAHSYTCVYLHIVFSTKQRQPAIDKPRALWNYVAGILHNHKMQPMAIGGMADHIHVLVSVSGEMGSSQMVNVIKSNSSRWMRETKKDFAWQEGYAVFSVSASNLKATAEYIRHQEEHHKKRDYKQEFIALLKKHGVDYDPRWVTDECVAPKGAQISIYLALPALPRWAIRAARVAGLRPAGLHRPTVEEKRAQRPAEVPRETSPRQ